LWWQQAPEPFQFLAACFELTDALARGPSHVTYLPISFDGSCSALQHLCAMVRAAREGELVNLTPAERPKDIYSTVAEHTLKSIQQDAKKDDANG
jgi:DNA-directed RNA polymerase